MRNKIKSFLRNKDYERLLKNFLSLSGLQVASYMLPLITLPYLVRVLGPDKFGLIAFATAFVTYFQILTDYGFNLSATREVSIHKDNKKKLSEIFSSVLIIKSFLTILGFILLSMIIFSFNQFKPDWQVYFLTFGMVIGNVLFPSWFFQGMERMKYITILNILAKVIFTVSIFIFVREISDFIYVPLINSLGFIVAGILGFWIAIYDFGIKLKIPSFQSIKFQLMDGWHTFISTMSISLYTASNTFILGVFTNNVVVSYYAVGEKIILAVVGLLTPISQAIYPYISRVVDKSEDKGINFIRKITLIMGCLGLILSLVIFIFAGLIVNILAGSQYEGSIIVLQILAFLPLIIGLSNVFGIQTMLTFNYKKAFSSILIIAGVINVVLALVLVPLYEQIGISVSFLITEAFVTLTMYLYLKRKGINILVFKDIKKYLKLNR